jgi:hypothetical protein
MKGFRTQTRSATKAYSEKIDRRIAGPSGKRVSCEANNRGTYRHGLRTCCDSAKCQASNNRLRRYKCGPA